MAPVAELKSLAVAVISPAAPDTEQLTLLPDGIPETP
jgi:hypothetical protein